MCGIAGFISTAGWAKEHAMQIAAQMASTMTHRGPDDAGAWVGVGGVALAHRRLSIVDLSAAGHQPMTSHSGRYVVVFNGEIYNHQEVRRELEEAGAAPAWKGHSDTETMLAGFDRWGVLPTVQKLVGMFAIAVRDQREETLYLLRDRFGEKPLYYGWVGGSFAFASELKALRAYPGFDNAPCREAIAEYMRFMYVPAPLSIYSRIFKLEPGCVLRVRQAPPAHAPSDPLRAGSSHGSVDVQRWWSLAKVIQDGADNLFNHEEEALETLEEALRDSIRLQSLADVPVGAFLSGGIDSSLIAALMQGQARQPIKTFTVGFQEAGFDESPYAAQVARHIGSDHTSFFVTSQEALASIPKLPLMYDEPFADSSQIPTQLVCQAARREVTVALSGDAGDELFGGYHRYFWGPQVWNKVAWLPYPVRKGLGHAIRGVPIHAWDALGNAAARLAPRRAVHRLGDKAHKLGARLRHVRDMDELYFSLVSEWQSSPPVITGDGSPWVTRTRNFADPLPTRGTATSELRMMYRDSLTYLPDDILCKVDRAAMSVSLETRVPFLDHRVAEVAWRLPLNMKIRAGQGKWALRQILYRHVPRALLERPKAGFALPIGGWLRGPLRSWAEEMLDERRLVREGYLRAPEIRRIWNEHLSGRRDWTPRLWSVLMFGAWLEANS